MISIEVGEPFLRRQVFNKDIKNRNLVNNLDLISKLRDKANIGKKRAKTRVVRIYNIKVTSRSFHPEDLVRRMRSDSRKTEGK